MTLFHRKAELTVTRGTGSTTASGDEVTSSVVMSDVDMEFTVERTITAEPSTLECTLYNLSENTRQQLVKKKDVDVELKVAYGNDDLFGIFKGNLRRTVHTRDGATLVTTIEAGDGERAQAQWLSKTYGKGTKYRTVIEDLVTALGIGKGNVADVDNLTDSTGRGLSAVFPNGTSVHGHAADELGELLSGKGIEYSIQNNTLQILGVGKATKRGTVVPKLTPNTGLVGVPTITNQKVVSAECLIMPGIYPGVLVDIGSEFIGGKREDGDYNTSRFKVRRCGYSGATRGANWTIRLEGRPEK